MQANAEDRRGIPPVWAVLLFITTMLVGVPLWFVLTYGHAPPPGKAQTTVTCTPVPRAKPSFPTFAAAPTPSPETRQLWQATVRTTCGTVVMVLDGRAAPGAVASFIELARAGYWDESSCDRLTTRTSPIGVLQCGNPTTGRRVPSPGYTLGPENVPDGMRLTAGTVAMVTPGWDANRQGEFLWVHRDFTIAPGSLGPPAVIGQVVEGMEVVEAVVRGGGEDGQPDWNPFINVSVISVDVVPLHSS